MKITTTIATEAVEVVANTKEMGTMNTGLNLDAMKAKAMDKLERKFVTKNRKRILKKDTNVTVNVLRATAKGEINCNITTMDENEAIRLGYIVGSKYKAKFGRSTVAVENHTKDLIVLDLSQNTTIAQGLLELHVWWNGRNTVFCQKITNEFNETVFVDILTKKEIKRNTAARIYAGIGGSPSMLRKDSIILFDITNGYEKMDTILDAVTDGGYTINKGKLIETDKLSKYVTRFFSWTAPNKVVGQLTVPAIYFGEYGKTGKALDGMAHLDANFYAECVSEILSIKVTAKAVMGESVQCRPYSAKVNALVTDMEKMMHVLSAEAKGIVYIPMNEVTSAVQTELNKAFNGEGKYANYIVVFGAEGTTPQFISDLNGYKTEVFWNKPSNFRVLDIAKAGKTANTSIQMWEVPMDVNPKETINVMKQLREEQYTGVFQELFFDRKISVPSLLETQKSLFVLNVAKAVAPDYVLDKDYAMFKKTYEEFFTRLNNADNKFKYAVAGGYTRLFADNAILVSAAGVLEFGEVFSPGANEYFNNGTDAEKFMNESKTVRSTYARRIVTMTKYPKMGRKEMYKATAVTLETVIARIRRLKITQERKQALISFYSTLKKGASIMPAVEMLKQLLAGMDFDYDGAAEIYDPRFNALISDDFCITNIVLAKKKAKPAVKTKKAMNMLEMSMSAAINSDDRIKICAENLHQAYLTYVTTNKDGWSVGSITNCNTTQLAALILAKVTGKEEHYETLRTMLADWFAVDGVKAKGGTMKYEGLTHVDVELAESINKRFECFNVLATDSFSTLAKVTDVSEASIAKAMADMQQADWSDRANLIAIFEDLNEMFRYYQEITIDSAKTGEAVTVEVAPGRPYQALMLNNNKLDFGWGRDLEETKFSVVVKSEPGNEKKTGIEDVLYKIRTRDFVKMTQAMGDNVLGSKKVGLNIADIQKLGAGFSNVKYKELNEAMFNLKSVYGDLIAEWMERREEAGEDKEVMSIIDKDLKASLDRLASFGRKLTANMSLEQRGCYVKFVSAYRRMNNGDIVLSDNGGNNFASKVFAKETLAFIVKHYGVIDFCGEELAYNAFYVDGDIITLVNGVSDYAITYANITGDFVVREFDGRFYATAKIVDTVPAYAELEEEAFAVRVSDTKELGKIVTMLNQAKQVYVRAESFRTAQNKMEHVYGIFDTVSNEKLCGIDCTPVMAKAINNHKGRINSIKCGESTMRNGETKQFIVVLF